MTREVKFRAWDGREMRALYRVESDGKRRHVDYDRRDHFEEVPDGTFIPWLGRDS